MIFYLTLLSSFIISLILTNRILSQYIIQRIYIKKYLKERQFIDFLGLNLFTLIRLFHISVKINPINALHTYLDETKWRDRILTSRETEVSGCHA